ncbi:MAG: FtsH protease activity modulator HflK [Polyangia bacterium]
MPQSNYPFGGGGPRPPSIDVGRLLKRYRKLIVVAAVLLVAIIIAASGFYTVDPEEVAVVTRFGRFDRTEDSGLRFRIPGVEQVHRVPSKRQLKLEFGFRTERADVKSSFRRDTSTTNESMMLTGDLNVAIVEWIVHYQITDSYKYVFKVRNVGDTLRALSEASMRKVVGNYSVTEVLTRGREKVLSEVKAELAELCNSYETGVSIQRVELKDSAPPDPVKESFNEVNQAEQERDRMVNEAWTEYNKVIPKARGQAKQTIEEAEGYAVERVNRARGEVAHFLAVQRKYAAAPRVTRSRLYLETLSEVLPQVGRKIILDEGTEGMVPMLFPLDKRGLPAGNGGAR